LRWKGGEVELLHPTPGGNSDLYQYKGFAGKAICKTMKTKASKTGGSESIARKSRLMGRIDLRRERRIDGIVGRRVGGLEFDRPRTALRIEDHGLL